SISVLAGPPVFRRESFKPFEIPPIWLATCARHYSVPSRLLPNLYLAAVGELYRDRQDRLNADCRPRTSCEVILSPASDDVAGATVKPKIELARQISTNGHFAPV